MVKNQIKYNQEIIVVRNDRIKREKKQKRMIVIKNVKRIVRNKVIKKRNG